MNIKFPYSALFLDSGGGWAAGEGDSFILFRNPELTLSSRDGVTAVNSPEGELGSRRNPVSILGGYLGEGYFAVGFFGYEFARYTEEGFIPHRRKKGDSFPDVSFLLFKESDIESGTIDNLKSLIPMTPPPLPGEGWYEGSGDGPPTLILPRKGGGKISPSLESLSSNMTKEEYIDMVRRAKDYIASGDVYQVNLSQRFTAALDTSPLHYFLNLYEVQPVPFACYMDFGEFQIVSGSMELFLRKTGGNIVTKPIKGTRKRGVTAEADAILKAELFSSEKERAENLMIVDLMRNDLGRICSYGTVKVNKLFDIQSYSTLHQMVSEIEGSLRDEVGVRDIIESAFPPGSVTGAPKRRALEVIDELEPHHRGPYCGAMGIFYPNGDFILSVAIRILVAREGEGTFWVGGGIVWDSEPESEYEETLVKARAIKKAMGVAE